MKFEGVSFNEELIRKMEKEEFIDQHIDVWFPDRSVAQRRKILSDIYKKVAGKGKDDKGEV